MPGVMDFVLGGIAPLAAAIVAYAVAWRLSRRAAVAWSAGVLVGYAAGAFALEARDTGAAEALKRLVRATDSHEWLPLIALVGALPALAAALAGRRWLEWLLAAPLCVGTPLWLLWNKYRGSQQLREAGFAEDVITPTGAALVLAGIAAATFAAWVLWQRAASGEIGLQRTRAVLAIAATVGAALAAALTGALVIGQAFGALAASLGGCAVVGLIVGDKSGPEAARGPVLLIISGLLAAGVVYSELQPWHAAALAAAAALPVGWLPGEATRRPLVRRALRIVLCAVPLTAVVWNAAATFLANEQPAAEEETGLDPLYDLYVTPPADAPE